MRIIPSNALSILTRLCIVLAIGLSIWIRVDNYLDPPPFFIDEANIARNLAERNLPEFWEKLDYHQYAPPIILSIWKVLAELMGYHEYALRALSMLCSFLCLILLYQLGKRYIHHKIILVFPLLAFGMMYEPILQSFNLKQYVPDLALALAFTLWTLKADYTRFYKWKEIALWIVLGSLAIWTSMPIVFAMASAGVYFALQAYERGEFKQWALRFGIIGLIWVLHFAFYYFKILHADVNEHYLQQYHTEYFLNNALWNTEAIHQNWIIVKGVFEAYLTQYNLGIFCFGMIYILGIYRVLKSPNTAKNLHKHELILLVLPLIIASLSSFWGYYSLIPRLMMFTFPIQILVAAIGIDWLMLQKGKVFGLIGLLICGSFLIQFNGWRFLWEGNRILVENTKASVAYVSEHRKPDEKLLVNNLGAPVVTFYANYYSDSVKYLHCKSFEWLNWDENISEKVKQTFKENPKDTLWLIIGNLPNEEAYTIRNTILADSSIHIIEQHEAWRSLTLKLSDTIISH